MPRVALTTEQRIDYKLLDFKLWVRNQMALTHKTQTEVGRVLGISQSDISRMIKVPDKKKKEKDSRPDPFSLGQVLALFELFGTDEEERKKLMML